MITVKIQDKEYTLQEARELYNELHALFGRNESVYPWYPSTRTTLDNIPTWGKQPDFCNPVVITS